jgi:hypothetical protein
MFGQHLQKSQKCKASFVWNAIFHKTMKNNIAARTQSFTLGLVDVFVKARIRRHELSIKDKMLRDQFNDVMSTLLL